MLVIMKHRNIHPLAADLLDDKAIRGFDIFQIYCAKGRLKRANNIGKLFRIGFIHLNVKAVNIGKFLE